MESAPSFRSHWRRDRVFWVILALGAVLGLIYNFAIFKGYAPDEPRHMAYVTLLLDEHRLPFLLPNGSEYHGAHSLHPPLYYTVLVPFLAIARGLFGDNGWHLVRVVSMLICLASLPLFYEVALRISRERSVARLAVAQLALLPIFGMTAGSINNDSASLLAFAVFLWLLVVRFENDFSPRAALWLGVALGMGSLCKATVVIADIGALLAFFLVQRGGLGIGALALRGVTGFAGTALFAAPWYVRNFLMYGKFSPIEAGYSNPALPNPSQGVLVMMMHDNFPPLFAIANTSLFCTLWSQKDWIPEALRTPIYALLGVYCVAATLGNLLMWWRAKDSDKNSDKTGVDLQARAGRRAAYAGFALTWIACLWMALFQHWGWAEGGRYLLAAVFGFSLFLALGWQGLVGAARLKFVLSAWCVCALAFNGVTVYWLLYYLNPTFGPK
jgi:4-amino-4-deoxy-L-arabinose transferase-like glycosyltransferase